jgi:predicted phosphodiesterase
MAKRILIVPDTQLPYDDRRSVKAVIQAIGDLQPDEVIHIGDLMDYPQPSRWNKDSAGEYEGSVFADSDQAKLRFFEPLRKVYQGPVGVHEGNHDERPRTYLAKYAPALAESGAFHIQTLLDFDGFGVKLLPDFYKVAHDWITTHGHRGQISLSRIAGNTALNAAKKFNTSVVMGHTHRLGISSHTFGYGGNVGKMVTGVEVGNMMNQKLAQYLKGGTGNWQQGFAILTVEGRHVKAETIPISNGKFTVDGRTWEV